MKPRFPADGLEGLSQQPLIRHLLWHRGIQTVEDAATFLDGVDPRHDAGLLPDIGPAVDRIERAVRAGERISVYGDFDVDGVTATAMLVEGLTALGANAVPFIPDRFEEGYGVHNGAIEALNREGASLIITADCGTSSAGPITLAKQLGSDVIVVDHHSVPPELPPAVAVINLKRDGSAYPERELSTGGLALRVLETLYEHSGRAFDRDRYLDLVVLSTVCDMVPLRGENRWLVREGLRVLRQTPRPGLRALMESAGCDPANADESTISFVIGPRLNAAGRLEHAQKALDLLLEANPDRAREIALYLAGLNQKRQADTAAACDLARELAAQEDPAAPLVFVGHADFSSGIVGLVAARLLDDYNRPAVVYQRGEEESRASCRSIPEFHITNALRGVPDGLLERFGGHSAAAGFTARNENIPAVKQALLSQAGRELAGQDLTPLIDIDAAVPLDKISGKFMLSLGALAPFGQDNPEPVFLSRDLEVRDVRVMGNGSQHLRLALRAGRVTWPAVAFGVGSEAGTVSGDLQPGHRIDAVYTFSTDRGSDRALELRLLDFAPSE